MPSFLLHAYAKNLPKNDPQVTRGNSKLSTPMSLPRGSGRADPRIHGSGAERTEISTVVSADSWTRTLRPNASCVFMKSGQRSIQDIGDDGVGPLRVHELNACGVVGWRKSCHAGCVEAALNTFQTERASGVRPSKWRRTVEQTWKIFDGHEFDAYVPRDVRGRRLPGFHPNSPGNGCAACRRENEIGDIAVGDV
jgi:hypothetical protein